MFKTICESILGASGAASWPILAPWEASKNPPKSGVRVESAVPGVESVAPSNKKILFGALKN